MGKPLVTVVVPVLNEEDLLEDTLRSLRQQTFLDFELIVVDNGSSDRSPEIAHLYADCVLHEPKSGPGWALHRGFLEAQGDFLLEADADTLYPFDWLEKMVTALSMPGVVAAYGPWAFRESSVWRRRFEVVAWLILAWLSSAAGFPHACGANFGVRRDAYFEVGGYPAIGSLAAPDFRLARRLAQVGRVRLCPRMVVYTSNRAYTQHGYLRAFWFWLDMALRRNRLTTEDWHSWRRQKSHDQSASSRQPGC